MAEIRRLTDSCVLVATDDDATLFDPGFHTFTEGEVDLDSIGDVTRVLVTHEHADHVNPDFVKWLIDRRRDVVVFSNKAVADLLDREGIPVSTDVPSGVGAEDVLHERLPNGARPSNRAWTIDGLITHPGDSYQPTISAPILALPLVSPWGSATAAVEFASRVGPSTAIMIHDYYLSASGRSRIRQLVGGALGAVGIEMLDLDWGQSLSV